jgi:hypothetical protein
MAGFMPEQPDSSIVNAQAASCDHGGLESRSRRPGSHDLQLGHGDFAFLNS